MRSISDLNVWLDRSPPRHPVQSQSLHLYRHSSLDRLNVHHKSVGVLPPDDNALHARQRSVFHPDAAASPQVWVRLSVKFLIENIANASNFGRRHGRNIGTKRDQPCHSKEPAARAADHEVRDEQKYIPGIKAG